MLKICTVINSYQVCTFAKYICFLAECKMQSQASCFLCLDGKYISSIESITHKSVIKMASITLIDRLWLNCFFPGALVVYVIT